MDILTDVYLLVDLYGDIDKKYHIICKMDFFDRLIDARTGREIFIEGMYKDDNYTNGLCCHNTFNIIDQDKALDIIKKDDIDEYNEYLNTIEKRDLNRKLKRVRKK